MAKTPTVNDETKYGERIAALEKNLIEVDNARVALEERVERLEVALTRLPTQIGDGKGVDSMGLPRVVGP